MEQKLNQDALFGDKNKKQDTTKVNQNKKYSIPSEYREVLFSSKGKLSAPAKLHFRDYSLSDLEDINEAKEEKQLHAILDAISGNCYEEFDCGDLHPLELEEVMATLYANFENTILKKEYYINDKLEDYDRLNTMENRGIVEIDLEKIKNKSIMKEFREPIIVSDKHNNKYKFRLERMRDYIEATDLIESLFSDEKRDMLDIENLLEKRENLTSKIENFKKELKDLEKELKEKGRDYFIEEGIDTYEIKRNNLNQSLSNFKKDLKNLEISKVDEEKYEDYAKRRAIKMSVLLSLAKVVGIEKDGKEIPVGETLNEKLNIKKEIPSSIWKVFKLQENKIDFGMDNEIKVKINDKIVSRRVRFQFMDFFPSFDESSNNSEITVQFGE